jgi:small multidrug resistance family-3 protein
MPEQTEPEVGSWGFGMRAYEARHPHRRMALILRVLVILVLAAALEVGGDALVRIGLGGRSYMIAAGAVTLLAYGVLVNKSGLDFNRLMGVYIAVFFVVSQVISFILFKQIPDDRLLLGGGFIVAGGLLILLMT